MKIRINEVDKIVDDETHLVSPRATRNLETQDRGCSDVYDFMGKPYRKGTPVNRGQRGTHTAVHIWVGDPR